MQTYWVLEDMKPRPATPREATEWILNTDPVIERTSTRHATILTQFRVDPSEDGSGDLQFYETRVISGPHADVITSATLGDAKMCHYGTVKMILALERWNRRMSRLAILITAAAVIGCVYLKVAM